MSGPAQSPHANRFRPEEFQRAFGVTLAGLESQGVDIDAFVSDRLQTIKRKDARVDVAARVFAGVPVFWRYRTRTYAWWGRFFPPFVAGAVLVIVSTALTGTGRDVLEAIASALMATGVICYLVGVWYFILWQRDYFAARPNGMSRIRWFIQPRSQLRNRFPGISELELG